MKTIVIAIFSAILFFACGNQKSTTNNSSQSHCHDTTATIVFVNKKSVEQRISISKGSSSMENGILINTYKSFTTFAVPKSDSVSRVVSANTKYMYTVYGPVSTNVNGIGVVGEQKFTLLPCGKIRVEL